MTVFTVVISSAQASSDAQIEQHYPPDDAGLLSLPYARIALYAVISGGALAAAVLPGRRAARTSVMVAMAET